MLGRALAPALSYGLYAHRGALSAFPGTGMRVAWRFLAFLLITGRLQIALTQARSDDGRLEGAMNDGFVEYVSSSFHNEVVGLVVPYTSFGVPYIEFTATEGTLGQIASFQGAVQIAKVVENDVVFPLTPNPMYSPVCRVNVNFRTIHPAK